MIIALLWIQETLNDACMGKRSELDVQLPYDMNWLVSCFYDLLDRMDRRCACSERHLYSAPCVVHSVAVYILYSDN